MVFQSGIFGLYRRLSSSELERLSYISFDSTKGVYNLQFQTNAPSVLLNFTDSSGNIVQVLTTGRMYYPMVIIQNYEASEPEKWYLYATQDPNIFELSQSNLTENRIFISLPPGTYTSNCNISGSFFVQGTNPTVAPFNSSLTDIVYLIPENQTSTVIANNCIPNCDGKLCTDDDGCGNLCGCPDGKVCSQTGQCVDKTLIVTPVCYNEDTKCGDNNGFCFGKCPVGYQCVRLANGGYQCIQTTHQRFATVNWLLIVGLILIALLVALVFFIYLSRRPFYPDYSNYRTSIINAT